MQLGRSPCGFVRMEIRSLRLGSKLGPKVLELWLWCPRNRCQGATLGAHKVTVTGTIHVFSMEPSLTLPHLNLKNLWKDSHSLTLHLPKTWVRNRRAFEAQSPGPHVDQQTSASRYILYSYVLCHGEDPLLPEWLTRFMTTGWEPLRWRRKRFSMLAVVCLRRGGYGSRCQMFRSDGLLGMVGPSHLQFDRRWWSISRHCILTRAQSTKKVH